MSESLLPVIYLAGCGVIAGILGAILGAIEDIYPDWGPLDVYFLAAVIMWPLLLTLLIILLPVVLIGFIVHTAILFVVHLFKK